MTDAAPRRAASAQPARARRDAVSSGHDDGASRLVRRRPRRNALVGRHAVDRARRAAAAAEPVQPDAGASPYWGGEPAADQPEPVASVPPGEPPQVRPWIAWVVFGAVGLGLVLAFAFGSQLVLPKGDAAPGEAIEEPAAEEPAAESRSRPDLTVDEQAAVDAVERYNEAWLTGDCDAFFATTTSAFRADIELTDCELFAEASRQFADSVDDYETIYSAASSPQGEMISVSTTEAYSSTYVDDSGDDTGVPVDYEDEYEYQLVQYGRGGLGDQRRPVRVRTDGPQMAPAPGDSLADVTTTPAGWYDDGHGAVRWWDGVQWTEHTRAAEAAAVAAPAAGVATDPGLPVTGADAASASPYYGATPGGSVPARAAVAASEVEPVGDVDRDRRPRPGDRDQRGGVPADAHRGCGRGCDAAEPAGTQAALATISLYDEAWRRGGLRQVHAVDDGGVPRGDPAAGLRELRGAGRILQRHDRRLPARSDRRPARTTPSSWCRPPRPTGRRSTTRARRCPSLSRSKSTGRTSSSPSTVAGPSTPQPATESCPRQLRGPRRHPRSSSRASASACSQASCRACSASAGARSSCRCSC